jgi:hypothetical protein
MQQEPMKVGEIFKQLLAKSPHQTKLKEAAIVCAWKQIMPPVIAQRVKQVYVHNHQLVLKVDSAPLRQEIEHAKDDLLMRLASAAPGYELRGIVWL